MDNQKKAKTNMNKVEVKTLMANQLQNDSTDQIKNVFKKTECSI